jgi:4-deoxy-L-threo-5-hexosulose-uronate ketol-isomerase
MTNDAVDMRWAIDPQAATRMGTAELRQNFLIETLFAAGQVKLTYTHYDRMVLGGAVPSKGSPLPLNPVKPMGTKSFLERRELIVINVGATDGVVHADGNAHTVRNKEMLYLGMGTSDVRFEASGDTSPRFYLISAPAHHKYDNQLLTLADTNKLEFGATETSNKRTIHQFAHANSPLKTCQLVAGITIFAPGSIWNTMPPHLHDRRMEAYLYFDLDEKARVFHMMGEAQETRHIVVANEQAVISPAWSIHSGVGTASYTFVWAMAGDNVDYTDVDAVPVTSLK